MPASAAHLLKVAKSAEKLGEISAAFDTYSEVLNNFPSNTIALRRRFDLDLLRKRDPETKSKESLDYKEINKKLELGIYDLKEILRNLFLTILALHLHIQSIPNFALKKKFQDLSPRFLVYWKILKNRTISIIYFMHFIFALRERVILAMLLNT